MRTLKALVWAVLVFGVLLAPSLNAQTPTKISDLPVDGAISGAELTVCVDGGVTRSCTLSAVKTFVGATGIGLANDITASPYNATCNGVADDSAAFESAVGDGGVFFVPPGSRCLLKTTTNHAWTTDTTFYGLEGAERDTHIDLDNESGDSFRLTAGDVTLRNLTIKNGFDFINANTLAATIGRIECINTIWDDMNTACVRFSTGNENAAAKIDKYVFKESVIENAPDASEGLFIHGGELRDVLITENYITGGKRGMRVGFVANDDTYPDEVDQRERFIITNNHIKDIAGFTTTSGVTVACIKVNGTFILIQGNICDSITDVGDPDDTECIYTKAHHIIISNNVMIECGATQGALSIKGTSGVVETCTVGTCAKAAIITGNSILYTGTDGTYNCVFIQNTNVIIHDNIFEGCDNNGVKVSNSGAYNNISIKFNQFYDQQGEDTIDIQGAHDNIEVVGNTLWSYNDSELATLNFLRIDTAGGQTMRWILIAQNRIIPNLGTAGDTIRGIRFTNSGTIEALEIKDNLFHEDIDQAIRFEETGTINRMVISGNDFTGVGDEFEDTGTQTINNCFIDTNRDLNGTTLWAGESPCDTAW